MAHLKCGMDEKIVVLQPASVILWTKKPDEERRVYPSALSHALNPSSCSEQLS